MSWRQEVSPYFVFHTHVQLVRGLTGAAIHDLFGAQLYWIRQPQVALACSLVAFGKPVAEAEREAGLPEGRLPKYLLGFTSIGLGMFADQPTAVEAFHPKLLRSQAESRGTYREGGVLTVEIANRCLYNCSFCTATTPFSPDACACGVWSDQNGSLAIDRLVSAIEELSCTGVDKLVIRGGEPFLEPERLWGLVETTARLRMMCEVHCTGNRIDDEAVRRLQGSPIHLVLLAATDRRERFEQATRLAGSFAAFLNAAKLLAAGAVPFSVKVPVSLADDDEGRRTAEWAVGLGAAHVLFLLHSCDCDNPGEELRNALAPKSPAAFARDIDAFQVNGESQYCLDNAYFIGADGRMTPCIGWRTPLADLKKTEMETVLRQEMLGVAGRMARRHSLACGGCEFRLGCRACLVRTIQHRGSAEARHWNCRYEPETATWR